MIHEAYGIVIDCEFPLPLPPAHSDRRADVRVTSREVSDAGTTFAPVEGEDAHEDVWIEMGWDGHRTVLRFAEVTAALAGDDVQVDPRECDDDDFLAHLILDHIIPRWLALQGDLVLHAGAVISPGGGAIALTGDHGRGKSSLTTALGQAGWTLLGDDACRLVREGDLWHAYPSYPGSRLTGVSREALVPDVTSMPMSGGADKHRVVPPVLLADGPAPLRFAVELGDERPTPSLTPLSFSQATASLTRHSFFLAPRLDEVAPRAFTLASMLAADIPCLVLEFPRRWDIYPELIELLERVGAPAA